VAFEGVSCNILCTLHFHFLIGGINNEIPKCDRNNGHFEVQTDCLVKNNEA
jgi:hypothetical protein